jgi:predicted transcriptional regulator
MTKPKPKPIGPEVWPVYLRLRPDLVAWLDAEARRQRRSRAFVVAQAVRMLRAVLDELERERTGE